MDNESKSRVDRFISEQISTVPHLEALLLVWNTRPKQWSVEEMGRSLYVSDDMTQRILDDLASRGLLARSGNSYAYRSDMGGQDRLMQDVDTTYRRELVRISGLIHSKASAAVRDFARAFRFKKD